MSENPTITAEIARLGPGLKSCLIPMNTTLRHKVLGFAIENEIPEAMHPEQNSAEDVAIGLIVARYFRMVESERFASWFNAEEP